jgi:hypothetical protein
VILARVRRDIEGGEGEYRDTGCVLRPACLTCPLPVCVHDVPGGLATVPREVRDAAIRQRWKDGESGTEIAAELGVSVRTVVRVIER